jgi:hypothetical protein
MSLLLRLVGASVPPAPVISGGWVEDEPVRRARQANEKRKREIWRSIERTIEKAYAAARGEPVEAVRTEVRQQLAERNPARVASIVSQLSSVSGPQAESIINTLNARLNELQQAALVYERMEQQARLRAARQNDDAIVALLMVI